MTDEKNLKETKVMNLQRREEIFSHEVITIEDLQVLYKMSYTDACKFMRELKYHGDRLRRRGKIHFEDYIGALKLKSNRYFVETNKEEVQLPNKVMHFEEFLQKY